MKQKHEKSILQLFLVPALIIMVVQGLIPLGMLMFSGVKETLQRNTVSMAERLIENKRVVLENSMTEQWSSIQNESAVLNAFLTDELRDNNISVQEFLSSSEIQMSYLEKVFPSCVSNLQHGNTSGVFLVLANDSSTDGPASYSGFYLRDSDPKTKNISNTDFLLERGSKILSRQQNIPLDSAWTTYFEFKGINERKSDDFFYTPYTAALNNRNTDMKNLGYWSLPFSFEEPYEDFHKMITYSVPLMINDTVYGILGAEISMDYLKNSISFRGMDEDFDAGVMLAVQQEDKSFYTVSGIGRMYEESVRGGSNFLLENQEAGLYRVNDHEDIYALKSDLNLYINNAPYSDTKWCFVGFVSEDRIFGTGNRVFRQLYIVALLACILGLICILILLNVITGPIRRLMTSVRGGTNGIHSFSRSGVREIDELHSVIGKLTDEHIKNEVHLSEEKEKYRIAIETSNDIFYTYSYSEKILEIVNSGKYDGVYDCSSEPNVLTELIYIHPADRAFFRNLIQNAENNQYFGEIRFMFEDDRDFKWAMTKGNVFLDPEGKPFSVAGYIRDIDFQKNLEILQKEKDKIDPVTKFFKLSHGLELVSESRKIIPSGIMALFNIKGFSKINDEYGLTFGDILLEEISAFIKKRCIVDSDEESVFIRAGSDKLLIWMPEYSTEHTAEMITEIQKQFSGYVDDNLLELRMDCGIAYAESSDTDEKTLLEMVRSALASAGRGYGRPVFYSDLSGAEKNKSSEIKFGRVVSRGFSGNLSPVSVALSLFDKGGKIPVILDILSVKLSEIYNIDDLVITILNETDRVNSVEYSWKKEYDISDSHVHYDESSSLGFLEEFRQNDIQMISEKISSDPLFRSFIGGREGIMVHMYDNGSYMGTVFFIGTDETVTISGDEAKELKEIGTIIQNRINQERHDQSAKAKTYFLSRMSHEIRTPMNGIIGMTEIALKKGQSSERITDCLRKIKSSSNYLLGLLNDILDMSKIESGKMQLVEDDADLIKMTDSFDELLGSKIEEKEIRFEKNISLKHSIFRCDELRISQVIINLLSNAVKFTDKGGCITLDISEKELNENNSVLSFRVSDNGCGISEEDQIRVFQNFEQANDSKAGRSQGTGLGLAISSRLVHMMDSDIKLESAPGKGSTFSFELQLPVSDISEISDDENDSQIIFENARILAAEDNDINLEIITAILENYCISVDGVSDGEEAVNKLNECPDGYYDLVLMDIMMPVMDGLEATRIIRKSERAYLQTIPIAAMSANAFDDDVRKSHECGMNDHLSKPVDVIKLRTVLCRYLKDKVKTGI